MTASDKATVKELKRQYGGKLKGKWLNVADYMLLVECDKYQTGNVLGVKLRKDDDVTTCDYAILDDEHVFCDLDGNSLAHEVELVYCVRFPKASKCRLHVEEKSGSVNTNKWIPVDDYVKLYENDVNTRNMSILAQIHRDGISIIHCVYERGAFRDIYTERLGIRPKYVCIIDIPNVKDIYYAALKTDDGKKHVERQQAEKAELTALADKHCVATFDTCCRYEHKELVTALSWVKLLIDKKEFYWELQNADTIKILNKVGQSQLVIPAPSLQELILIATSIRSKSQSDRVLLRIYNEYKMRAAISQPVSEFIDNIAKIVLDEKYEF